MTDAISLLELNRRIAALVGDPSTQGVWVTAELSDVAVRRGHCYMELLQKDDNGVQIAKARGVIWANNYSFLASQFAAATGQAFATGLKLMVKASATMHPLFGLSMVISDIDPDYTMGDLLRRRREILTRLQADGILELNRQLPWTPVPQRIAVISAPGAAGYGDFINQLYHNQYGLRFKTQLFEAVMQGEKAAPSIIKQLEVIAAEEEKWDCVVIIRGGGATSDLQCFENYDLAANIAQFPLPIIIGIGHERDITLLDYVANMRVKTPTAAAEWLVGRGVDALSRLQSCAQALVTAVNEKISGQREQLTYYDGILRHVPLNCMSQSARRLDRAVMALVNVGPRRIAPQLSTLDSIALKLRQAATNLIAMQQKQLEAHGKLREALSPQSILDRGFSITRFEGKTVTCADQLKPGDKITTVVAHGTVDSIVN